MTTKLTFSIKEACVQLNCGKTKLYELINSGRLKASKQGHRTIIKCEHIQEFLNSLPDYQSEAA